MPTARVHVSYGEDGVRGKVTLHAPYASADEMPRQPDADGTAAVPLPHTSADVSLDELPSDVGPALVQQLHEILAAIGEAAQARLTRRLADAVATARNVAVLRGEISR